jgi:hypothetical protein
MRQFREVQLSLTPTWGPHQDARELQRIATISGALQRRESPKSNGDHILMTNGRAGCTPTPSRVEAQPLALCRPSRTRTYLLVSMEFLAGVLFGY